MKYYGVIVTYNRKQLLTQNLIMLEKQSTQLDKIIIIDNHSTDNTKEMVFETFPSLKQLIDYRYMDENTGGAGGFYYGVKFAYEAGADFVYLMDDDGKPYDNYTFERIKTACEEIYPKNKLIFLNSLVTTNGKDLSFGFWSNIPLDKQLDEVKARAEGYILKDRVNPFNGTLISKELVEKIGYPRKEFFLSRDETDYMVRSIKAGAFVATITNSVYCHPKSKLVIKKLGKLSVQTYADLDREYYYLRNMSFTYKDDNSKRIWAVCVIRFITIILYENQKLKRIKQIYTAVNDAKNNRMGKRIQK